MTPRFFNALCTRLRLQHEREEFLFGQLTAVTANFSMGRPKEPLRAVDFMPSQWGKAEKKPNKARRTRKNRAAIAVQFRTLFAMHGGTVPPKEH